MCECTCYIDYPEVVNGYQLELRPKSESFSEINIAPYQDVPSVQYRIFDRYQPRSMVYITDDLEVLDRMYDQLYASYHNMLASAHPDLTGNMLTVRIDENHSVFIDRINPTHTWYHVGQVEYDFLKNQQNGFYF